jgi:VIT1/CCC1 family predicted Fe2+/Mn2+ transporter
MAAVLFPAAVQVTVAVATLVALGILGALGAQAGGAPRGRAALRVMVWGVLAMAATSAIGVLVGIAI